MMSAYQGDGLVRFTDLAGHGVTVSVTDSGNTNLEWDLVFANSGGTQLIDLNDAVDVVAAGDPTKRTATIKIDNVDYVFQDAKSNLYAIVIKNATENCIVTISGTSLYGTGYELYTKDNDLKTATPAAAGSVYIGYLSDATNIVPRNTLITDTSGLDDTNGTATWINTNYAGGFQAGIYVTSDTVDDSTAIGKIMVDGTVTGQVNIAGSIGMFYCGWLITGDVRGFGSTQTDNFSVTGDLGSLLVKTSIGTNLTTYPPDSSNAFYYNTATDIHVGGTIGNIEVGGMMAASLTVDHDAAAPSLANTSWAFEDPNGYAAGATATPNINALNLFRTGYLPYTSTDIFANNSIDSAYYLGGSASGSVTISGNISNASNGPGNNRDVYAVSLTNNQTITVSAGGGYYGYYGIMDSERRVVAISRNGSDITYTATNPGLYYIILATSGDYTLDGTNATQQGYTTYTLTVSGLGDQAIGGIRVGGDIAIQSEAVDLNNDGDTEDLAADTGTVDEQSGGFVFTTGNVGAIVAGGAILSISYTYLGAYNYDTYYYGSQYLDITQRNVVKLNGVAIKVTAGDLGAVVGGTIGRLYVNGDIRAIEYGPVMDVSGKVGLVQATGSFMGAYIRAGGNIETLASGGEMGGRYFTTTSIGIIRAGQMTMGTADTQFSVNTDNIGRDGIIDLIEVTGDFGTLNGGGPRITTNTGGNVRYIHLNTTSWVYQDVAFNRGQTSNLGGITYVVGTDKIPAINDDSGAKITFSTVVADPLAGATLSIWTYGIYGAGGSAIIRVETNAIGLNVTSTSGNNNVGQTAEIGEIIMTSSGAALQADANGFNYNPPSRVRNTDGTVTTNTYNSITIGGSFRTDVFKITGTGSVINTISNTTGGDIVNINAKDIGALTTSGNLGVAYGTFTGVSLDQGDVISNSYPFYKQHNGVLAGSIGTLSVAKTCGAIIATGSVGTISLNPDNKDNPLVFEGLDAPIMITGGLYSINIGEGIASAGDGVYAQCGLFVGGTIYNITGNNADIRGVVVSKNKIKNITLTNGGSIVDATVAVLSDFAMSRYDASQITLPDADGIGVANVDYEIESINITGKGGIIGSWIAGADIGTITVSADGFGIIGVSIGSLADGVLKSVSAGGYGICGVDFSGMKVGSLTTTNNGKALNPANYSARVVAELTSYVNSYHLATSGMITESEFGGLDCGNISAYGISNTTFNFVNSVGTITSGSSLSALKLITGTLAGLTVNGNTTGVDIEVAGRLNSVLIKGNVDATSLFWAKGNSGDIGTFNVTGSFAGTLISQGLVNSLTFGQNLPNFTGNVTGTVELLGSVAAGSITIYGALNAAASFEIDGDINGAFTIAQGIGAASTLEVHGNVGSLVINKNGLLGTLTVDGNLKTATINGPVSGDVTVTGNLTTFTINGATAAMSGDIVVGGSLGTLTLSGTTPGGNNFSGTLAAAQNIGTITITNGDLTGSITSTNGNIAGIIVNNGYMNGDISALQGTITNINVTKGSRTNAGNLGASGSISAKNLTNMTVGGSILDGTLVNYFVTTISGTLGTLTINGDVGTYTNLAVTGNVGTVRVAGDVDDNVAFNFGGDLTSLTISGRNGLGQNEIISVAGNAGTINITGNIGTNALLDISGALTSLTVSGSTGIGQGTRVNVDGKAGNVRVSGNVANDVRFIFGNDLTSLTISGRTGLGQQDIISVAGNAGTISISGAMADNSTIDVTGNLTTLSILGAAGVGDDTISVGGNAGTINITGNIGTNALLDISGALTSLTVSGSTGIGQGTRVNVDGKAGNVRVSGNVANDVRFIFGNDLTSLTISGRTGLGQQDIISVAGNAGTISISGAMADNSTIDVTGNLTTLSILGAAGVGDDTISVGGNAGTINITGNIGTNALLDISGALTSLTVSGSTGIGQGTRVNVDGKAGNVRVSGNVANDVRFIFGNDLTSLTISGRTGLGQQDIISVAGNAGTISISGAIDSDSSIGVTGNLNTLTVSGAAGIGQDDVISVGGNAGTISITGAMVTGSRIAIVGNLTASLNLLGAAGLGTNSRIAIGGNASTINIAGVMANDSVLDVTGNLTTLTVSGAAGIGQGSVINVDGNAGTIRVVGNIADDVTLDIAGALTSLTVSGTTGLGQNDAIIVGGNAGTININGGVNDGTTLGVTGDLTTLTIAKNLGDSDITVGGNVGTMTIRGNVLAGALIRNTGKTTTITITGNVADTAEIQTNDLNKITISGNMDGDLVAGRTGTLTTVNISKDFGSIGNNSTISLAGNASLTVAGNVAAGSVIFMIGTLTSGTFSKAFDGSLSTNGNITNFSAKSMTGGVILAGGNVSTMTVNGDVRNSLIQVGVSGTGSQALANLATLNVRGLVADSVIAASGNITSASISGVMDNSSISSGLALAFADTQTVVSDLTPLATPAEINALRSNGTLFYGSINTITVNGNRNNGLINGSTISAGYSAGPDGDFATAGNNVKTVLGTSLLNKVNAKGDGSELLLA